MLTFWQPKKSDLHPSLTVNLQAPYRVEAARLILREIGLDYESGKVPGPVKYTIEGLQKSDSDEWIMLLDRRDNQLDKNCDYNTFPPVTCECVRLTIYDSPQGIGVGVIDFTVFGKRDETVF